MAKKHKTEDIDDILREKEDEFESGRERQRDSELDDLVWEMGRYEDREPLDSEAGEFSPGRPSGAECLCAWLPLTRRVQAMRRTHRSIRPCGFL